jgi:hypothetical protein
MQRNELVTGNLGFKRSVYSLTNVNALNTVYDYTLEDLDTNKDYLFTDIVRIEKDLGYHKLSRHYDNLLYFRNDTNWKRCKRTGLATTTSADVFYGDLTQEVILKTKNAKGKEWETPEHLILVQIDKDFKKVVVDIFKHFHTYKKELIALIIKEHKFYI